MGASRKGVINLLFPCNTEVLLREEETEALRLGGRRERRAVSLEPRDALSHR